MKRSLCYVAPVFDEKLKSGDLVNFIFRNRKGKVLAEGEGEISSNRGQDLLIETGEFGETLLRIEAKDVYHGKHSLQRSGGDQSHDDIQPS